MRELDSAEALHIQVARHFRGLIREGRLRPGQRLRPLRQIAHELGASINPVQTAFRALEREGLVHRRHGIGVFVGEAQVRLPATLEIGVLFRCVPAWRERDNYLLHLFAGVHGALERDEHRTLLVTVPTEQRPLRELPTQFRDNPAHAYIVDEPFSDKIVAKLAEAGRPVMVVNRRPDVDGVSATTMDNYAAGVETARQMLARGHLAVGFCGADQWNSRQFMAGFLDTMEEAGAPVPVSRIGVLNVSRDDPRLYFRQVMATSPTAVYFGNDRLARSFYMWAADVGLRIPQDVSVVGCLDLRLAAELSPPLTTVRFDPEEMGRRAVQELIALCETPGRAPVHAALPGEWVERESLAPAP